MKQTTRREFLSKTVLGAVGAGVALRALDSDHWLAFAQLGPKRAYQSGKHAIFIDGALAGWLESVEGGNATSEPVVNQKFGLTSLHKETPGTTKYQEITLTCGIGMSQAFYQWIKDSLDGRLLPKSGAISTCDFDFKELERMEFSNALITEVGFPALDATSKDEGRMTIKVAPESTRMVRPSGAGSVSKYAVVKKWLPSNFRLKIDGLDCSHVNKIEALTIKQQTTQTKYETLSAQTTGAQAQTRRLIITLPESDSAGLNVWRQSMLVNGSAVSGKKNGQLEFLTSDKSEALFTLNFWNLGLIKITAGSLAAGSTAIKPLTAELSYEEIKFDYGSAWV